VHRGGDVPLLGVTIWRFFENIAAEGPEREAVVSLAQHKRLTYAGLQEEATKLAKGLVALHVVRGDRVGIWSTNNLEWVLLQMAAARIGAILVNINPAYPGEELQHALACARVQVLFFIPSFRRSQYAEMVSELCPNVKDAAPGSWTCPGLPAFAPFGAVRSGGFRPNQALPKRISDLEGSHRQGQGGIG
jgi:fatty-acyl-CoA synthase